jgi:dipeptidyl aminopeptidase/acylaminoacyl peptidase
MNMKKYILGLVLTVTAVAYGQDNTSYKLPPKDIMELALAEPTPSVLVDGKGEWMILANRSPLSTVEELGQPEVRVAGLRINPNNFSMSRMAYYTGFQIQNIKTKQVMKVAGLPAPLNASGIQWSDDEKKFAFVQTNNTHVDLYVVTVADGKAVKVNSSQLNGVLGTPYRWVGNDQLIYKTVPAGERTIAARPIVPNGPVIQENLGKAVASRTYQDLIRSAYDEELFSYLATSQLVINDMKQEKPMGGPAVYKSFSVSPDKRFLLTETIDKPYSYLVTYDGFPYTVSVLDMNGQTVNMVVKNPSAEGAPIGFDDVVSFPRDHAWRADEPATITYVVALDKGLGRSKAEYRDALYAMNPLTKMAPRELFKTTKRFSGVIWGDKNHAIVYENMNANRKIRMSRFDPTTGKMDSLFERSSNDAYSDIGQPWTKKNEFGRQVLFLNGKELVLYSTGSSPEGDLPFVQTMDINNGTKKMLWRCQAPYYESLVKVLDPEKLVIVTSRESLSEPPNYFIRDLKKRSLVGTQITQFTNPYKALDGVTKQKISYKRADGVDLTGNLYTPKGFDPSKDKPLPVLIWAYPREYKSAADAAQVRGSKYVYPRLNWGSPVFWVTQGFAILDNAEMPIVGEGTKEPNDNFIPQLYLNAHAAIQHLAKMGVGDSNRVAVGGHSYGAFMTANLLAHTNLFKAGLARSGAYNRTLTPFGFQAEERTYWQAPDVYFNMSPFSYADKIKTPILLIHGELDNNPGTFPIQSERLYNAVKGHGGTVRYVVLPYESHGYSGQENVLHMLWEMDTWMKTYLK